MKVFKFLLGLILVLAVALVLICLFPMFFGVILLLMVFGLGWNLITGGSER